MMIIVEIRANRIPENPCEFCKGIEFLETLHSSQHSGHSGPMLIITQNCSYFGTISERSL